MIVLDATIVNVALPSIQDDLGFSQSSLAWVVNAYLIAFGGLLLLAGRLGDLVGRRSVFLAGLAVFTLASLACGLAQSQEVLVVARFVQGVGGALTSAVILGMIVTMFPSRASRRKRSGSTASSPPPAARSGCSPAARSPRRSTGTGSSSSTCRSPPLTGLFALRAAAARPRPRPRPGRRRARRAADRRRPDARRLHDRRGHQLRLGLAHTLGFGAGAVALLAAFVVRESRARNPLVPLRIFRSRNLAGANAIQSLMVAGMFGMFFLGALFLQRVLGFDSLEVGLAFLPVTGLIGLLSLGFSAKLNLRFGPRATLLPGLGLVAAGLLFLSQISADGSYWAEVLPAMALIGAGAGLSFPSLMSLAMGGVAPEEAGLASGLVNTSLQVGGALGLAVLATLATNRTTDLLAGGDSTAVALTDGYRLAFLIAAGLVGLAVAVAALVLEPLKAAGRGRGELAEPAFSSEAALGARAVYVVRCARAM